MVGDAAAAAPLLDLEAEAEFRRQARAFIDERYPSHLRTKHPEGYDLSKAELLQWHRILAEKGWIAPGWPREFGGPGWTPAQRYIWQEELARADTIPIFPLGITMVGPVIFTFGSDEQKARFLPGTLSGDIWWCQGFSEPGAGSDLAALRTSAVRDGDDYIVNGQKTWTTLAQYADWGFFLVRTDPQAKPQAGISFLLIDMTSPGVTVRPIATIDGAHEVNEIWLENVRVPVDQRVHDENGGWTCAKFLLTHERLSFAEVARSKRALERLTNFTKSVKLNSRSLFDDPHFRRKLTEIEVELAALECTERRMLAQEASGRTVGVEASLLKIKGSEIQQRITELRLEASGCRALLSDESAEFASGVGAVPAATEYINMRKTSIYGGSNEIQRNMIAKGVLGLG